MPSNAPAMSPRPMQGLGRLGLGLGLMLACGCTGGSAALHLAIAFPGLHTASLPDATVSVPVVVDRSGSVVAAAVLSRAQPRLTLPNLPSGRLTVYAAALGSDQQVLALGKAPTELKPGQIGRAVVELLPLQVFGSEERQSVMASIRQGFPMDYGLGIAPLPPGDGIVPGGQPTAMPVQGLQLGALTAQPRAVPVGYPVLLSVAIGADGRSGAGWDFQWQAGATETGLTLGALGPTQFRGERAEAVWTPDAPGTFVLRLTVTDGQTSHDSNEVTVTVTRETAGATVGGTVPA